MKNERIALNINELETVSGGTELNYGLFDPADNLTEDQMKLTMSTITVASLWWYQREYKECY